MGQSYRYVWVAVVIAVGMMGSAWLISEFFVKVRTEKEISVKGYAEAPLVADVGRFDVSLDVQRANQADAYAELQNQFDYLLETLSDLAPPDTQIDEGHTRVQNRYKRNEEGRETDEFIGVQVSRDVRITSHNVAWIASRSRALDGLIGRGMGISISSPDYLVSDLTAVKMDLLEQATANAYQRATILAQNSGAGVGTLTSARQGVFQITEPNSTATSSYGIYDTESIDKVIKAVVTLEYAIR